MSHSSPAPRRKILVAVDDPQAAAAALPAAHALARQLGDAVEALHVSAAPLAEPDARRRLGLGGDVVVSLRTGDVAAQILRDSERPDVEMVALAARSHVDGATRTLGGVTRAVIAASERPILIVWPEATARPARPFKRLLLPLDATPTTATALTEVLALADRLEATIDVLYVIAREPEHPRERGSMRAPKYVDQPQHEWAQWADEVMARFLGACGRCPAALPVSVHVRQGEVGPEIARFAAAHHHDAIVLVRRSHLEPGRAHALRAVLQQAPCPILLVGTERAAPEAA